MPVGKEFYSILEISENIMTELPTPYRRDFAKASFSAIFHLTNDVDIYRYGHINVLTLDYPYQTHTFGGPI